MRFSASSIPFLVVLSLSACGGVHTDYYQWLTAEDYDKSAEATDTIRTPFAAADAIYGLNRRGYARVPYDGSVPEQRAFPGLWKMTQDGDSEPCLLVEEGLSANAFVECRVGLRKVYSESQELTEVWWLSPPARLIRKNSGGFIYDSDKDHEEETLSLVAHGNHLFVVTTDRILSIWKGQKTWESIPVKSKLDFADFYGSRVMSQVLDDDTLWYGADSGEFGGTLIRVNLDSGEARVFDDMNVTGIAKDPDHPDCVLVSAALAHLFTSSGVINRMCGEKSESLYKGDMPIWGLFESEGEPYALLQTGVVPLTGGKFDYDLEQKFKDMGVWKLNDIPVTRFGNAMFLYLNARGSDSTGGGGTPFVITLPSGVKPVLTEVKAAKH